MWQKVCNLSEGCLGFLKKTSKIMTDAPERDCQEQNSKVTNLMVHNLNITAPNTVCCIHHSQRDTNSQNLPRRNSHLKRVRQVEHPRCSSDCVVFFDWLWWCDVYFRFFPVWGQLIASNLNNGHLPETLQAFYTFFSEHNNKFHGVIHFTAVDKIKIVFSGWLNLGRRSCTNSDFVHVPK